ncbi:hypothetical protein RchiOBHm_Chr6g0265341 [Rosa chinensis]|uniref:Uncharacterized protein n=1 Tax=Rosa chinensis TaxID=74649 RepID=A0A2P6PPD9_ROSCH|nr:hypothetical protein RchiOBHm_Chr6g0265341 [Rosa chinensis]
MKFLEKVSCWDSFDRIQIRIRKVNGDEIQLRGIGFYLEKKLW